MFDLLLISTGHRTHLPVLGGGIIDDRLGCILQSFFILRVSVGPSVPLLPVYVTHSGNTSIFTMAFLDHGAYEVPPSGCLYLKAASLSSL